MTKKVTLKDFEHLAKVLDENRHAKIPDSHWAEFAKVVKRNNERAEAIEKTMTPTWEDMQRRFTL